MRRPVVARKSGGLKARAMCVKQLATIAHSPNKPIASHDGKRSRAVEHIALMLSVLLTGEIDIALDHRIKL